MQGNNTRVYLVIILRFSSAFGLWGSHGMWKCYYRTGQHQKQISMQTELSFKRESEKNKTCETYKSESK